MNTLFARCIRNGQLAMGFLLLLFASAKSVCADLQVDYFPDRTGHYTLNDLQQQPELFHPLSERTWNWDVRTHWYRIPLSNSSSEAVRWVLSCGVANPPLLRAYWVTESGITYPKTGDTSATTTHYARHTNVSISLHFEAGETGTLFVEYRSLANFPLTLRLVDEQAFLERSYSFTLFNGMSLGVAAVLLLFFIVQFCLRPAAALVFYCLFVSCILLFMVQIFGYGWLFFFPEQHIFSAHLTALAAAFIYVFYFLFTAHAFDFRRHSPLFYRSLLGVSSVIALLALTGLHRSMDFLLAATVVAALPLSVIGALKAAKRREPGAKLFLLGSFLHCSLTYLLLLVCLGIDLGFNAFALATSGQFLDVLCLSAAILLQQRHVRNMLALQMAERERDMAALTASEHLAAQLRNQSKEVVLQSATASHDLLQLLAAMRLQLATQSQTDPIINQLHNTLAHADAMLRNRLQLNRSAYQQLRETIDGKMLIETIADSHITAFRNKGITFDVAAAPVNITCLPLVVRRVLDNLLHNALRHMEKGRVLLTGRARRTGYLIQVRDTGPGIPAILLHQLNQPFSGRNEPREGFGLGLYIVHTLCREAGYGFTIDSRPGRGTCCSLWIPIHAPPNK